MLLQRFFFILIDHMILWDPEGADITLVDAHRKSQDVHT